MKKEKNDLDQMYQKLQEEDDPNDIKKWNEAIIPKFILLFPLLIFLITFLRINNDKSIVDLITFILFGGGLVLVGILLNFALSDK
tara:strand:- start:17036 stop:17290 length:255 start_codon:yes stop_codon:yes gene_type:complete